MLKHLGEVNKAAEKPTEVANSSAGRVLASVRCLSKPPGPGKAPLPTPHHSSASPSDADPQHTKRPMGLHPQVAVGDSTTKIVANTAGQQPMLAASVMIIEIARSASSQTAVCALNSHRRHAVVRGRRWYDGSILDTLGTLCPLSKDRVIPSPPN